VFVTGRPARWLRGVADAAEHHNLIIGANGGFIADMKSMTVTHTNSVDNSKLQQVVARLQEAHPTAVYAIERSYVGMPIAPARGLRYDEMQVSTLSNYEFAVTPGYSATWSVDANIPVAHINELIDQSDITKLIIKPLDASQWTSDSWLAEIAPIVGEDLQTTHASHEVVLTEISAKGITKGFALALLAGELGLTAEDVVAVGDMPNDIPMLQWAGEAWAVANAHQEVLDVTLNRLAHHDESPVADLIADLVTRLGNNL